jgi:hypothetical protein
MDRVKFRRVFRLEVALLVTAALLFILPMKFGVHWTGGGAEPMIWLYYASSLFVIACSQLAYMGPLRRFVVEDWTKFTAGAILFVALVAVWFSRFRGLTIDFSDLGSGALLGPLLFAMVLPVIQGFIMFTCTGAPAHITERQQAVATPRRPK